MRNFCGPFRRRRNHNAARFWEGHDVSRAITRFEMYPPRFSQQIRFS